jgi:proteasome accessory factor B
VGEQHLLTLGRPDKDPGRTHLAVFGEALGRRRRVEFRYHAIGAERTTTRCVHPYGLGHEGGNWHVVGWDESREGLRNFRLDRIRGKVQVVDKEDGIYEVPDDFDASKHIGAEEFEIAEGPEVVVTVELDPTATWLMERRRQGIGELTLLAGGRSLFEVPVRSEDGLFRWLAELGEHARIVEPKRLAKAFSERLEGALALYED